MWFFNDRATKEETTFQLEQFRKQGILEFYIHPTYGMRATTLTRAISIISGMSSKKPGGWASNTGYT